MISVVGGVYREYCMHPAWREAYGSAGRAASALAAMEKPVTLHSYLDPASATLLAERAALEGFSVDGTQVSSSVAFDYAHCLAVPTIFGVPPVPHPPMRVQAEKLVRFGMLEGDAIVQAKYAVYDPQNQGATVPFGANGSKAEHLALILNLGEARRMSGLHEQAPEVVAAALALQESAEVVLLKMGPRGALVWSANEATQVPAFRTTRVWKIGSGDCFVAHFASGWMHQRLEPVQAALQASKATAYYCQTQGFPTPALLAGFNPQAVAASPRYLVGAMPKIYLAGPFFNLPQHWMIEQARDNLREMGLQVFSPFHDIGLGSAADVVDKDIEAIRQCDLMFAIAGGLDAGTVYEIGYARALGKPVIVYSENESEENLKMMSGSGCVMASDYATAIYSAIWEAVQL
jgi:nucleoside 2-deoxyribosyltransferase